MYFLLKKIPVQMKSLYGFLSIVVFISCRSLDPADIPLANDPPAFPGDSWQQVADPSQMGWSNSGLAKAKERAEKVGTESLMIIDEGRLIAAWGEVEDVYYIASCRKSILSTLFGTYVDSRVIPLDTTLGAIGITDKQGLLPPELEATVGDLLTSQSGIFHPAAATDNSNLPARGSQPPGEAFFYNNWDFNALGTIFNTLTGDDLYRVFEETIAIPTGMEDFERETHGRYDFSEVSEHPAYHFDMSARDMARFGLLCLRGGRWNGNQLIGESWLQESTQPRADAHDFGNSAYGYMWWVVEGDLWGEIGIPDGSFSAQGNWAQLILIIPDKELVVVHRGKGRRGDRIKGEELVDVIRLILEAQRG